MALFYPPESNANAMTASHATMTSAVTAPAVIFAFSLNVYSRIVSAKTSDNESRGLREDIHSRHRIRKEIVLVVRVESCDASATAAVSAGRQRRLRANRKALFQT